MNRFQVVTYSWDIGIDDRMDYDDINKAIKEAKKYKNTEEYAAIYDSDLKMAYVVFGNIDTCVFVDSVKVIPINMLPMIKRR